MSYQPKFKTKYREEIIQKLMDKFQYKSIMQVPKLTKICLSQGVGQATSDKKLVDIAVGEMTMIAGQKAVKTVARKSIANFKLREDMPIGSRVTLRRDRMLEFLERLVAIALPRMRDFRGINDKSFDGRGNYTLGVTEQIIFPEIDLDKIPRITGLDITFVTTAQTDAEALELLKLLGLPFKNQQQQQNQ